MERAVYVLTTSKSKTLEIRMQGIPEYKDTGVLSLMEKASMAYGFEFFEWQMGNGKKFMDFIPYFSWQQATCHFAYLQIFTSIRNPPPYFPGNAFLKYPGIWEKSKYYKTLRKQ